MVVYWFYIQHFYGVSSVWIIFYVFFGFLCSSMFVGGHRIFVGFCIVVSSTDAEWTLTDKKYWFSSNNQWYIFTDPLSCKKIIAIAAKLQILSTVWLHIYQNLQLMYLYLISIETSTAFARQHKNMRILDFGSLRS